MSQVSFSQFMQCKLCGTEEAELRRRVLVNGSVQIVYQCLTCGRAATNAIAKSSVRNADSLPDWDEAAQERYNVRHEVQRLTERQQGEAGLAATAQHLPSFSRMAEAPCSGHG